MTVSDAIKRTLVRIGTVSQMLLSGEGPRMVFAGLSKEFGRVMETIDAVYCASVPSENLCPNSLDDIETKYGLAYDAGLTTDERIDRIMERATTNGSGGPDWLEAQLQAAGFPLYVIENSPTLAEETQFGNEQFDQSTQFGLMPNLVDPANVPGILITSSANRGGGLRTAESSQFGTAMFGTSYFGTADTAYMYPQPAQRQLPTDPAKWNKVFFLSPFPDRLAAESELLIFSDERRAYLVKMVTQLKYLRNWCIAQIAPDIQRVTTDGSLRVLTDDTTIRRI